MVRGLDGFDSYAEWLDLPVDRRPPNHYELLGLQSGEGDAALIRNASVERSARVRRYCLGPHGTEATRLLGELGAAFACLSDPILKAAYDRQLIGEAPNCGAGVPPGVSEADETPTPQKRQWAAASDSSEEIGPPPIRHDSTTYDDEAPPRRIRRPNRPRRGAHADGWQKPQRQFLAVGAALVLAATCGVVWSARRPLIEEAPRVADRRQVSVAVAPTAAPSPVQPSDRTEQPAVVKATMDTPTQARPAPTDRADAIADREDSTGRDLETTKAPARNGDPAAPSASAAEEKVEIASAAQAAALDAFGLLREPPETPTNRTDHPVSTPRPTDNDQGAPGDMTLGLQADKSDARILPPLMNSDTTDRSSVWRLSTGDDPELLELTLDGPVDVAHLELLEPSEPVKIDRAIIKTNSGSTVEMGLRPVPFYQDGIRRWSFGATHRARTNRLLIRFRPTEDGFVELAGAAVYDYMGIQHIPVLVRAVRKTAGLSEPAAATTKNHDTAVGVEDDAMEELARQELRNVRDNGLIAEYAAFFKDPRNKKTKAAIEAISDLEQMVHGKVSIEGATLARRILVGLAKQTDTPLGQAASEALRSEKNNSPR